jgi:hypothetical protein
MLLAGMHAPREKQKIKNLLVNEQVLYITGYGALVGAVCCPAEDEMSVQVALPT